MINFPRPRQLLLPAVVVLVVILVVEVTLYNSDVEGHAFMDTPLHLEIRSGETLRPSIVEQVLHLQRGLQDSSLQSQISQYFTYTSTPSFVPRIAPLLECPRAANPVTRHIRLANRPFNISLTSPGQSPDRSLRMFNPTLMPLPYWSGATKYVLVSRVVTSGLHQESLICLADFCIPRYTNSSRVVPADTRYCTSSDIEVLGPRGGLRCTTEPSKINIPPTPAKQCYGAWASFPDIPGFHDPRAFWSGKGEPLIIVNSASSYGCVGLWIMDLRMLYSQLNKVVNRGGKSLGPALSYPHLTEITRNPKRSRENVEKNWILWFPSKEEAYVQYNMVGKWKDTPENIANASRSQMTDGRTFAKLIGNGYTTPNLTDPGEASCFAQQDEYDSLGMKGHWHQGSNSLRLILCTRAEAKKGECAGEELLVRDGRSVHFAIIHRKFSNGMDLPMRYERYAAVWEGRRPFRLLGISKSPILMQNERANPWSVDENWPSRNETLWQHNKRQGLRHEHGPRLSEEGRRTPYFTYTPSLSWAWRPGTASMAQEEEGEEHHLSSLGTGYLGDDVLIGIGMDDVEQAFVKVKVETLLQCLRLCPAAVES